MPSATFDKEPTSTPTLATEINALTRRRHTELNRLIVDRLPLALPPYASDPSILGRGLAAFSHVYFEFEAVGDGIANSTSDNESAETHHDRLCLWLSSLRPTGLSRSVRLHRDIDYIAIRTGMNLQQTSPAQRRIYRSMARNLREKPHTLVAYSWIMYMAIFSGGRWICKELASAGQEFWFGGADSDEHGKQRELTGFCFLSFEGDGDGEDIKALFKARLAEAETFLTPQERNDVLAAAQGLFDDCIVLVGILDQQMRWEQTRSLLLRRVAFSVLAVFMLAYFCRRSLA